MNKYAKEIKPGVFVDVYDVLNAYGVTCPATQHAIKKLLMPGKRGSKSVMVDLKEAQASIVRAMELVGSWSIPDAPDDAERQHIIDAVSEKWSI